MLLARKVLVILCGLVQLCYGPTMLSLLPVYGAVHAHAQPDSGSLFGLKDGLFKNQGLATVALAGLPTAQVLGLQTVQRGSRCAPLHPAHTEECE